MSKHPTIARVLQAENSLVVVERTDGSSQELRLDEYCKEYRDSFLHFEREYFAQRPEHRDQRKLAAWNAWRTQTAMALAEVIDPFDGNRRAKTIVVQGNHAIQVLPWEAFRDCEGAFPGVVFVRRPRTNYSITKPKLVENGAINVLLVVARPFGDHDIRPSNLSKTLRTVQYESNGRLNVDVLRGTGSLQNLNARLEERSPDNRYNIVHFDVHGRLAKPSVLRQQMHIEPAADAEAAEEDEREQAFLLLEKKVVGKDIATEPDFVSVQKLARALVGLGDLAPDLVVLNACQSASPDISLALDLVRNEVRSAIGIRHPIEYLEARNFANGFYRALAGVGRKKKGGKSLTASFRSAYSAGLGEIERLETTLASLVIDGGLDFQYAKPGNPIPLQKPDDDDLNPRDFDELKLNRLCFETEASQFAVVGPRGAGKSKFLERIANSWLLEGFADRTCLVDVKQIQADHQENDARVNHLQRLVYEKFATGQEGDPGSVAETVRNTQQYERVLLIDGLDEIEGDWVDELQSAIKGLNPDNDWVIATSRTTSPDRKILNKGHVQYHMVWDWRDLRRQLDRDLSPLERVACVYADGIPGTRDLFLENVRRADPDQVEKSPEGGLLKGEEVNDVFDTFADLEDVCGEALQVLALLSGPPFPRISRPAMRRLLSEALHNIDNERNHDELTQLRDQMLQTLEKSGLVSSLPDRRGQDLTVFLVHPLLVVAARKRLAAISECRRKEVVESFRRARLFSDPEAVAMGERHLLDCRPKHDDAASTAK